MPQIKLLAFSSSKVGSNEYLQDALPVIKNFLGSKKLNIAFIPFASAYSYQNYFDKVNNVIGNDYKLDLVLPDNASEVIKNAEVILVGGGNTFKLLHDLYFLNLISLIREKVNGGTPYIGWSAGSNIAGKTISTSNDMAIILPQSFDALNFLQFNINPHYTNKTIEGHNGESREQRLEEFLQINSDEKVICLPEGCWLKYENKTLTYNGISEGTIFETDKQTKEILKVLIKINENISRVMY